MERVKVLDQDKFRALVRAKVGLFQLKMHLKGEMTEISPPQSLVVAIELRSRGGIIQLSQKVSFSLKAVDEGNTEVSYQVVLENIVPFFLQPFLRRKATAIAQDTLLGIRTYLEQLS